MIWLRAEEGRGIKMGKLRQAQWMLLGQSVCCLLSVPTYGLPTGLALRYQRHYNIYVFPNSIYATLWCRVIRFCSI